MADKKKNQKRKPAPRKKRRIKDGKEMTLAELFKKRKEKNLAEFKPDATTATWGKTLKMTQQQRLRYTKWGLYILTIILSMTVQDVIMSQFNIFGATTDLAAVVILLITVMEGTEVGSLFVIIASTLYYFTGTAPGAYSIGFLTFLGIAATLFRQMFWHRSQSSILLCSGIAVTAYELGLFVAGLLGDLTRFGRIGGFLLTAVFSCAALFPLYIIIHKIGTIGGNTWKE